MNTGVFFLSLLWIFLSVSATVEIPSEYKESSPKCFVKIIGDDNSAECLFSPIDNNCTSEILSGLRPTKQKITDIRVVNYTVHDKDVKLDIDLRYEHTGREYKPFFLRIKDRTSTETAYGLIELNTNAAKLTVRVRNFPLRNFKDSSGIHLEIWTLKRRNKRKEQKDKRSSARKKSFCERLTHKHKKTEFWLLKKNEHNFCKSSEQAITPNTHCSCWKNDLASNFNFSVLSVHSSNFCFNNASTIYSVKVTSTRSVKEAQEEKETEECTRYVFYNLTDSINYKLNILFRCRRSNRLDGDMPTCTKVLTCNVRNRTRSLGVSWKNSTIIDKPSFVLEDSNSNITVSGTVEIPLENQGRSPRCSVKVIGDKDKSTECLFSSIYNNCTSERLSGLRPTKQKITDIRVVNYTVHDKDVKLDIDLRYEHTGRKYKQKSFILRVKDKASAETAYGLIELNRTTAKLTIGVRNFILRNFKDTSGIHIEIWTLKRRNKRKEQKDKRSSARRKSFCERLTHKHKKTEFWLLQKNENNICKSSEQGITPNKLCSCWKNDLASNFSFSVLAVHSSNFCFKKSLAINSVKVSSTKSSKEAQAEKGTGECSRYVFYNLTDSFTYKLKILYRCLPSNGLVGDMPTCSKVLTCNVRNETTRTIRDSWKNSPNIDKPSPVVEGSISNINDKVQRLHVIIIAVAVIFSIITFIIVVAITVFILCRKVKHIPYANNESSLLQSQNGPNILLISHSQYDIKSTDVSLRLIELMSCSFKLHFVDVRSIVERLFGHEETMLVKNLETDLFDAISEFKYFVFLASHDLIEPYQEGERHRRVQKEDPFIQTLIRTAIKDLLQNDRKRHHVYVHFISIDKSTIKYCKQLFSLMNPPKGRGRKYCLVKDSKLKLKDLRCLVTNLSSSVRAGAVERSLQNIDESKWVKLLIPMNNCQQQKEGDIESVHHHDSIEQKPCSSLSSADTDPKEPEAVAIGSTQCQNTEMTTEKQVVISTCEETNEKVIDDTDTKDATKLKDVMREGEKRTSLKTLITPTTIEDKQRYITKHIELSPELSANNTSQIRFIESQRPHSSVQTFAGVQSGHSLTELKQMRGHHSNLTQQETGYFSDTKREIDNSATVCKDINDTENNTPSADGFVTDTETNLKERITNDTVGKENTTTQPKVFHSFLPQSVFNQPDARSMHSICTDGGIRNEHFTYSSATSQGLQGLPYHESGGFCAELDVHSISDNEEDETTV